MASTPAERVLDGLVEVFEGSCLLDLDPAPDGGVGPVENNFELPDLIRNRDLGFCGFRGGSLFWWRAFVNFIRLAFGGFGFPPLVLFLYGVLFCWHFFRGWAGFSRENSAKMI